MMGVTFYGPPDHAGLLRRLRSRGARTVRCAAVLTAMVLTACQSGVLDPRGPIGQSDKTILIDSLAIMLAIVVPTIAAILGFAWWYRASNTRARYRPDWDYSGQLELITWSIPLLTIILLGGVTWIGAHNLDPARRLAPENASLDVQVISLDWKWLFIYPGQHVASVNKLVVPAGTPIHFTLTSASVMNAFFIPQLGSMIYTMNGMATQLNLQVDHPGTYAGLSSHYSGDGFSDMHFNVEAVPRDGFAAWVDATRSRGPTLTAQSYMDLARQSMKVAPLTYRDVDVELFRKILVQALPPGPGPTDEANAGASKRVEE